MITVVTVNWHSAYLIEALIENLISKAQNPQMIKVLVIDNTNGADKSIGELKDCSVKCDIYGLDSKGLLSSAAHAFALDYAFKMIDTEFTLIIDPDVYVFKQNWDTFCINHLEANDVLAVGAPYPLWKIGKYHNFPSPVFCFFKTDTIKNMKCPWKPHSEYKIANYYSLVLRLLLRMGGLATRKRYENSSFLRKFSAWAEQIFGIFSKETGWRIAQQAKQNNMKSIIFNAVLPQDVSLVPDSAIDIFQKLACEFELYYYNNEPMLTHKYTTGSAGWQTKKGSDVEFWKDCIERFESKIAK